MAVSTEVLLLPGETVRLQFTLPDHEAAFLGSSNDLLVQEKLFWYSLLVRLGRQQVPTTDLAIQQTGGDTSGIRCREIREGGRPPPHRSPRNREQDQQTRSVYAIKAPGARSILRGLTKYVLQSGTRFNFGEAPVFL